MNQRIKELALECYSPYTNFDHEKFALLIVQETLQVARAGIEYGDGMETTVYRYFGIDND